MEDLEAHIRRNGDEVWLKGLDELVVKVADYVCLVALTAQCDPENKAMRHAHPIVIQLLEEQTFKFFAWLDRYVDHEWICSIISS